MRTTINARKTRNRPNGNFVVSWILREEELERAQEKVRRLNDRYSDWYYVVVEDTYKKLMPAEDDLILAEAKGSD